MEETSYQRIAISGDPGSGKTTFARNVAKETGFELITTGNIFRELAREKGITVTELNKMAENQKDIDYKVDDFLISLNDKPGNYILDSRMAWHFVKGAFKIRLTVRPEVAVERIFQDEADLREKFDSLEMAEQDIRQRRESEINRYRNLYGVDISAPNNFDLIIDTSDRSFTETLDVFLKAYSQAG